MYTICRYLVSPSLKNVYYHYYYYYYYYYYHYLVMQCLNNHYLLIISESCFCRDIKIVKIVCELDNSLLKEF